MGKKKSGGYRIPKGAPGAGKFTSKENRKFILDNMKAAKNQNRISEIHYQNKLTAKASFRRMAAGKPSKSKYLKTVHTFEPWVSGPDNLYDKQTDLMVKAKPGSLFFTTIGFPWENAPEDEEPIFWGHNSPTYSSPALLNNWLEKFLSKYTQQQGKISAVALVERTPRNVKETPSGQAGGLGFGNIRVGKRKVLRPALRRKGKRAKKVAVSKRHVKRKAVGANRKSPRNNARAKKKGARR